MTRHAVESQVTSRSHVGYNTKRGRSEGMLPLSCDSVTL